MGGLFYRRVYPIWNLVCCSAGVCEDTRRWPWRGSLGFLPRLPTRNALRGGVLLHDRQFPRKGLQPRHRRNSLRHRHHRNLHLQGGELRDLHKHRTVWCTNRTEHPVSIYPRGLPDILARDWYWVCEPYAGLGRTDYGDYADIDLWIFDIFAVFCAGGPGDNHGYFEFLATRRNKRRSNGRLRILTDYLN